MKCPSCGSETWCEPGCLFDDFGDRGPEGPEAPGPTDEDLCEAAGHTLYGPPEQPTCYCGKVRYDPVTGERVPV